MTMGLELLSVSSAKFFYMSCRVEFPSVHCTGIAGADTVA